MPAQQSLLEKIDELPEIRANDALALLQSRTHGPQEIQELLSQNYGIEIGLSAIKRHRQKEGIHMTARATKTVRVPAIKKPKQQIEVDVAAGNANVNDIPLPEGENAHDAISTFLRGRGIDPDAWDLTNLWVRDVEGNSVITGALKAKGEPEPEIDLNNLRPIVPEVHIRTYERAPNPSPSPRNKQYIIIPDEQIGFFNIQGQVYPLHDERCMDIVLQIMANHHFDFIGHNGDTADMTTLSSYRLNPGTGTNTEQMTLDRIYLWLAEINALKNPAAPHVWVEGNHEKRLLNYVLDNAPALFGLHRALMEEEEAVLSIPSLLRLEELDVKFIPGYPKNSYWITERLQMVHGKKVSSTSSVSNAFLNGATASTIYGHTHTADIQYKTIQNGAGSLDLFAASAGTFSRVDGIVPGTNQGMTASGVPILEAGSYNWTQGILVGTYDETNPGEETVEFYQIRDGKCIFRGQEYTSRVDINHVHPTIKELHHIA